MSPSFVDLALQKQRLQLQSAAQREALVVAAAGLVPALSLLDTVREGTRWLARHPEWVAGGIVALVVARPRVVLRWLQRGFFAWQMWRKVEGWRRERASSMPFAALARFRKS